MSDMAGVITPKSDQINADDLIAGPMTITITDVRISGGTEQPVSVYFEGSDKAYRPCKSMCRVLVAAWGADANMYRGRSLTLYCDPSVKWGGVAVGGIRISHMSHIQGDMNIALTATRAKRVPFTVRPLAAGRAPAPRPAAPAPVAPQGRTRRQLWDEIVAMSEPLGVTEDQLKKDLKGRGFERFADVPVDVLERMHAQLEAESIGPMGDRE